MVPTNVDSIQTTQNVVSIQVQLTVRVSITNHSDIMVASIGLLNKTIEWTIEVRERKKCSLMMTP